MPQMISFGSGSSGFGAFWQSSTVLPSSSSSWHSSAAWSAKSCSARLARLLRERMAATRTTQRPRDDADDCDERTDASTHRSSCPGLSPR